MSFGEYIILFISLIPAIIILSFIPNLTRKTENFGVSIPEDQHDEPLFKEMRKKYTIYTLLGSVIIFTIMGVVLSFIKSEKAEAIILISFVFIWISIYFIVYLPFHFRMKKIKAESDWKEEREERIVIHTGFRNESLTYSNAWFLLAFFIVFMTSLLTLGYYHNIPDKIPMHYDFNGNVTRWADKTPLNLSILPSIQLLMVGLFLFINIMIKNVKQQLDAANPERSRIQGILFRRRWSAYIIGSGIGTTLLFMMIQLSVISLVSPLAMQISIWVFTGINLTWVLLLSILTGQGGSRIKVQMESGETVINRDDDRYWILGQFYFNPADPSTFVEKRFGVGWTVNNARVGAWILWAIVLAVLVGTFLMVLFVD